MSSKVQINNRYILLFFCLFLSTREVEAQPNSGRLVRIFSFNDYEEQAKNIDLSFDADSLTIQVASWGLQLLQWESGSMIPVLVSPGKNTIHIAKGNISTQPDNGNAFLLSMLTLKNDINFKRQLLEQYESNVDVSARVRDVLPMLEKGLDRLTTDFLNKMNMAGNGRAGVVLKALELRESSSNIKTIDDLVNKRSEFISFVHQHAEFMCNSELLKQLAFQYLMMHEYVYAGCTSENDSLLMQGIKLWTNELKDVVAERESVEYVIRYYYDRSMISKAGMVLNLYPQYNNCYDTNAPMPEKLTIDIGAFKVLQEQSNTVANLKDLKSPLLIIAVSDAGCIASVVKQILLMRNKWISYVLPVVTLFAGQQPASVQKSYLQKYDYYIDATAGSEGSRFLPSNMALPSFWVVDENIQMIATANNMQQLETILEQWEQEKPQ